MSDHTEQPHPPLLYGLATTVLTAVLTVLVTSHYGRQREHMGTGGSALLSAVVEESHVSSGHNGSTEGSISINYQHN